MEILWRTGTYETPKREFLAFLYLMLQCCLQCAVLKENIHDKQEEVEGLKKDMRTASSRRDIMSSMLGGQRLRLAI